MQEAANILRFYFITDDSALKGSMIDQVRLALSAGATVIQYRNKQFGLHFYEELRAIRDACRQANTPLLINDNVLLAKAISADGVHLGQDDDPPQLARQILGPRALIGLSISSMEELRRSHLKNCDYLGVGPVFATDTKPDANPVCGLEGLEAIVESAPIPVVAIGGISAENAGDCFQSGAAGVAVISAITRAQVPQTAAQAFAKACGL